MDNNQTQFDEGAALHKFIQFADATFNKEGKVKADGTPLTFTITKQGEAVIRQLLRYFAGKPGLDPTKGIMLQGPTGTGKTTVMRLFSLWLRHRPNGFRMVNCRDIQKQAAANGFESLYKYTKHSYKYKDGGFFRDNGPVTYCFDDFGAESKTKFYGTEINVMEELIQDRYNEHEETGMKTHATTNLKDGNYIEELYGPRVRDRLRQMFNFVELNGQSFRR